MINRSEIPKILSKIDILVTEYARVCGLDDSIFLWKRKPYGEMRTIHWKSIFDSKTGLGVHEMTMTEITVYVEETHPLYFQVSELRLKLIDHPDLFELKDLKKLNDIWEQLQLLKDDGGIRDHVLKTINDTLTVKQKQVLGIKTTTNTTAPNSQSAYIVSGTVPPLTAKLYQNNLSMEDIVLEKYAHVKS